MRFKITFLAVLFAGIFTSPQMFAQSSNPFTSVTTIQFQTTSNTLISLDVYDQTGREIASLINGILHSGTHAIDFDGSLFPAGIYFIN